MIKLLTLISIFAASLLSISCSGQKATDTHVESTDSKPIEEAEPHKYGGWYCPDNFGFVPVNISELDDVPAISDRLPTEEELQNNMSLINVDTEKYPDAHAYEMDLPRVAKIYSERKGMSELIIVIQAIIVQNDTVVGYRFANGGNGSAWLRDVTFLNDDEVTEFGSQPFYYSKSIVGANPSDLWNALTKTEYFGNLGNKFNEQALFSSKWNPESYAHLNSQKAHEQAVGYVGMVYGNYYLQIDYNRNGFHYSEKLLMVENEEEQTTEFFFASGPYPTDYDIEKPKLEKWVNSVISVSEAD